MRLREIRAFGPERQGRWYVALTTGRGAHVGDPRLSRRVGLGALAQKAESAARRVIPVDARNTSRTCPSEIGGCGHVPKENHVTQTTFECVKRGLVENADRVGALNVLHRTGPVLCTEAWPPPREARDFDRGWRHGIENSSSGLSHATAGGFAETVPVSSAPTLR
ncbi:zinc ribbon domain-containing protein [Streptomyces sp. NPDC059787]|uniref:zinc ribbon domain-containing protein n=1 Tax=Streptomyces sp. NPDC059787 TaxID=3346947 RepID=UPI0036476450